MGSSKTGQGALQTLPSKSQTSKRNHIRNYALPENAIEKVLSSASPTAAASTSNSSTRTGGLMNKSFSRRRNSFSTSNSTSFTGGGGNNSSSMRSGKDGIAVWKVNKVRFFYSFRSLYDPLQSNGFWTVVCILTISLFSLTLLNYKFVHHRMESCKVVA